MDHHLPIHNSELHYFPGQLDSSLLYHIPPVAAITTIVPQRCPYTNEILDFIEVPIVDSGTDAKNSMSFNRTPGPIDEATSTSAKNYPFWPGGALDKSEEELKEEILSLDIDNYDFENDLLNIPPGFSEGIDFSSKSGPVSVGKTIDLLSIIENDSDDDLELMLKNTNLEEKIVINEAVVTLPDTSLDESLFEVKKVVDTVLKIGQSRTIQEKLEYAEMIDVTKPITDFQQRIPDMAYKYPFELDNFQKQAILQLEEHNHVFVAAHTSAGKTAVAEYAIALSKRNMTKTIYTSPIKALSNQKYRDFKKTFKEVGLITGDIQIDSEAQCLIMTTEILRSMLYCGSDITRDLQFVIFDEVHYITDQDRGHVWEEVLILLPAHVCIVMLSATVPNTLEFANWVGRTKKRKVFVISTLKRPVPLQHYLYTGNGGKSRDDIFLVVDEVNHFSMSGYEEAKKTRAARQKDYQKFAQKLNAKQEQTLWVGLIDHLKRKNKLPVVAFTLSRNRCDNNAEALKSVDLCTGREKFHIHSFFNRCLMKLKLPDRSLPQILTLKDSLERGIGIHHSGILPILKEIVEMLFQSGLVKLLFATETFAMGVNMPARTVIFDSTSKFDGDTARTLQPAEYTQMAGRAGRRGLDDNGTVIILCKTEIPQPILLKQMILGKPMSLESKFRLTYSMILSLLRVEMLTVEDMMSNSFREYRKQLRMPENKEQLKVAEAKISSAEELSTHLGALCEFHDIAYEYIAEWNSTMPTLYAQSKIVKELKPGRVLIVSHMHYYNRLGILLWTSTAAHKEITYKVLILNNASTNTSDTERGLLWHRMLGLSAHHQTFIPDGIGGHDDHVVLQIQPKDIVEITKSMVKVDADKIIRNWDQRQIPRFKDAPLDTSLLKALTELANLHNDVLSEDLVLEFFTFSQEFHLLEATEHLKNLKEKLIRARAYTDISNFDLEFAKVFDRKQLEKQLEDLKFQMSSKNLTLYPDYMNKLHVLEDLKYIDEFHQGKNL